MAAEGRIDVRVAGRVARLVVDNPDKRNAVSMPMWRSLRSAARELSGRADVRAVLVAGGGERAFCAGADLGEFATSRPGGGPDGYDDLVESACRALESLPQTTIAVIRGPCAGAGNSIAASCDLRIAARDAYFAHPAVRLGLGYDPRGIARFAGVYGLPATRYLLLSGERLDAARAYGLGIVHEVHPAVELDGAADAIAERVSRHAPLSVAAAKAALRALAGEAPAALREAAVLARRADGSADYEEGRRAFQEKREPRFEGR